MVKGFIETQRAIKNIKTSFIDSLSQKLHLTEVTGSIIVELASGLNDDLSGLERSVTFTTHNDQKNCTIVNSLAKWKRYCLASNRNELENGGIVVDMKAIRRDEVTSPVHSYYVDQWDWEKIIEKKDRTMDTLKSIVSKIYSCLLELEEKCNHLYETPKVLPKEIHFVSAQELEDLYPNMSTKEKEYAHCKKHGAIFVTQIGKNLKSGSKHELRAPDYDDWELNGDIIVYYKELDIPLELSSMGIRVCEDSLKKQLKESKSEDRLESMYHKSLVNGEFPCTVGGGIGQSRTVLFMLKKKHIGEVHSSVWEDDMIKECAESGIMLL